MTARRIAVLTLGLMACASATVPAGAQTADENMPESGVSAFLRDQRITTLFRADYFEASRTLDERSNFAGATLQLKALPHLSESIEGKIEARFIDSDLREGGGTDRGMSRLLEAYATVHFANAELRIGKQIIAWGRADGINPTDNLTPRDYTVLLPFDEDQRFGTVALRLDTFFSREISLILVTTPFFEPSVVPIPAGNALSLAKPKQTLADSELALKLNKSGGDFDWSVSYFHGRSLLPSVSTNALAPQLRYGHIDVFGADFARNFGRYGFRSELAYIRPTGRSASDANVDAPRWFWVIGVDRTLLENLNINLQFFTHRMSGYRDPGGLLDPMERDIAEENAIILGQEARMSNGITFRISNKWFNQTLEAEIFTIANFAHNDRYVRPLVSYVFNDYLKGTLGAELYRGSAHTQYGILKGSSGVFAELRYGL